MVRNKTGGTALQVKVSGYSRFPFPNSILNPNHFHYKTKEDASVFGVVR